MTIALWVVRRIAAITGLLAVTSFLVFAILHLTPGSPEQILLGGTPATPEALAAVRARYHLDEPFLGQYRQWLGGVVRFDFGRSIQTGQPVAAILADRLPVTVSLAVYAGVIVGVLAVPAGLLAGIRNGTAADRAITTVAMVGISAPPFAVGILLLYVFGVALDWFPVFGVGTGFVDRVWHLTLPAVALALTTQAIVVRQTRAAALSVYAQDFTTFARARGLPRRVVLGRYALRNSSLPVVTASGLVLASVLTGAVLIEQTFALPGIGSLMVTAVANKDIPVVQAVSLFAALVVLTMNLLADLAYAALDPRARKVLLR